MLLRCVYLGVVATLLVDLTEGQNNGRLSAFQALDDLRQISSNSVPAIRSAMASAVPGQTYPTLSAIPDTAFTCARVGQPGYYADPDTGCQVFRQCLTDGGIRSFICANQTLFNQITLVCDWWYNVNCAKAASYYTYSNPRVYQDNVRFLDDSANGDGSMQNVPARNGGTPNTGLYPSDTSETASSVRIISRPRPPNRPVGRSLTSSPSFWSLNEDFFGNMNAQTTPNPRPKPSELEEHSAQIVEQGEDSDEHEISDVSANRRFRPPVSPQSFSQIFETEGRVRSIQQKPSNSIVTPPPPTFQVTGGSSQEESRPSPVAHLPTGNRTKNHPLVEFVSTTQKSTSPVRTARQAISTTFQPTSTASLGRLTDAPATPSSRPSSNTKASTSPPTRPIESTMSRVTTATTQRPIEAKKKTIVAAATLHKTRPDSLVQPQQQEPVTSTVSAVPAATVVRVRKDLVPATTAASAARLRSVGGIGSMKTAGASKSGVRKVVEEQPDSSASSEHATAAKDFFGWAGDRTFSILVTLTRLLSPDNDAPVN
ncbi:hypothetical protein BV898_01038 [Hypsibius exemplaris]|uniref:Chitin-binding type-2 domain-containing protein n=1 Tax=Hypsibius exemplaris TaxID=2072580 RepID=A0A1W0XD03_HYPEX|nr:hypothetical protein BV898_01038 [Hypsibius exemplaris]